MGNELLDKYRALIAAGELDADPAQAALMARLDRLGGELIEWRPRGWAGKSRLSRLFTRRRAPRPRGLYIHGKVGRGKTLAMDLFFESVALKRKRRVHFHQFMAEVHDSIDEARKNHDGDPIPHVAKRLTSSTDLLCFDELHVTDIADAMILGRLFEAMFSTDVVVVATSNNAPHELYRHGLNRPLFEPFIDLIDQHMDEYELLAEKDYRLEKLSGRALYFTPVDNNARVQMDRLWSDLTGGPGGEALELVVKGHRLPVPQASMGAARFNFDDLCAKPLGSVDYLHIAMEFHTVMIDAIPVLTPELRNEARRFINLIDTLYDNRICLVASADAVPHSLYIEGHGVDLFARTASRLIEMQSREYLKKREERNKIGIMADTE